MPCVSLYYSSDHSLRRRQNGDTDIMNSCPSTPCAPSPSCSSVMSPAASTIMYDQDISNDYSTGSLVDQQQPLYLMSVQSPKQVVAAVRPMQSSGLSEQNPVGGSLDAGLDSIDLAGIIGMSEFDDLIMGMDGSASIATMDLRYVMAEGIYYYNFRVITCI